MGKTFPAICYGYDLGWADWLQLKARNDYNVNIKVFLQYLSEDVVHLMNVMK